MSFFEWEWVLPRVNLRRLLGIRSVGAERCARVGIGAERIIVTSFFLCVMPYIYKSDDDDNDGYPFKS